MTTYDFEVVNNDTYNGATFTITVNGVLLNLTGATIELQCRKKGSNELVWGIDTDDGITITDAENGEFEIDEQVISATPGTYPYDVQITLSSGSVKTYVGGEITFVQDYTE
jgi:hypothetical protein